MLCVWVCVCMYCFRWFCRKVWRPWYTGAWDSSGGRVLLSQRGAVQLWARVHAAGVIRTYLPAQWHLDGHAAWVSGWVQAGAAAAAMQGMGQHDIMIHHSSTRNTVSSRIKHTMLMPQPGTCSFAPNFTWTHERRKVREQGTIFFCYTLSLRTFTVVFLVVQHHLGLYTCFTPALLVFPFFFPSCKLNSLQCES